MYVERTEQFFIVNSIGEDKKVAVLLSSMGPETYRVLSDLLYPVKPKEKNSKELANCLQSRFSPPVLKIAERFKLMKRTQRGNEDVSRYATALRQLAVTCQYGAFLDDALTQCFVCGLINSGVQRRLLLEQELTFKKAVELATALEKADLQSGKFHKIEDSNHVNTVQAREKEKVGQFQGRRSIICFRCKKEGHISANCRVKGVRCYRCGQLGHIARVCTNEPTRLNNDGSSVNNV